MQEWRHLTKNSGKVGTTRPAHSEAIHWHSSAGTTQRARARYMHDPSTSQHTESCKYSRTQPSMIDRLTCMTPGFQRTNVANTSSAHHLNSTVMTFSRTTPAQSQSAAASPKPSAAASPKVLLQAPQIASPTNTAGASQTPVLLLGTQLLHRPLIVLLG